MVKKPPRRIFVVATDSAGCWWYRLRLPLMAMDPDLFEIIWEPPFSNWRPGDVVIGQRIAGDNAAWLEMCAEPGLTAVYDIDDNLLEIDPANTVPHQIFAPMVEGTKANIAAAQVVTASTPKLAEYLRPINPNVVVLPNYLHSSWVSRIDFPWLQPGPAPIKVGWAGSPFHNQDFLGAPELFLDYARQEPRAQFHVIGGDPTMGLVARAVSPFTDMHTYWSNLDFDIGLIFLSMNVQNQCKSWVKALEYMGKGAIPIAPNMGQYPDLIDHGVNGFLYTSLDEALAYLTILSDDQRRSKMNDAAIGKASEHIIERHVHRWEAVYREV